MIARPEVGEASSVCLADATRDAVAALAARRPRAKVDESVPGWNEAFVSAIRAFKEQFRSSPDLGPALAIASEDLYGRDIHWALELIQNAEDAGARQVTFVFEHDRVTVANDGALFTNEDVWGICSAGHSPKKNKIGFFGIGFKSVFMITDAPEVRSGPYAFRITEKIYPEPLDARTNPARGARFILPVRSKDQARLETIAQELTRPEFLRLLLTLTSLETIRVVDRLAKGRGRFYRRVTSTGQRGRWDECVIGGSWPGCEDQRWRRYRITTGPIPEGIQRRGRDLEPGASSAVVLARPVERPVGSSQLHCFLPLDVQSELRWLVQADFDPTPGRERLRENAWNRWLMGQVGLAIAEVVVREARDGNAPWSLIPLITEVTSPLQRIAFEAAIGRLRDSRFVRTNAGWRIPSQVCWPTDPNVGLVVRESDLQTASGADVSYVRGGVLEEQGTAARTRATSVLAALGGRPIVIADLIRLICMPDGAFYREARTGDWWLRALDAIARLGTRVERTDLSRTACIPLEGGGRVRPSPTVDLTGYLVAYSRSASLADLHSYFTATEILVIDRNLEPKPNPPRRASRPEDDAARARVRDLLTSDEFRVAPEAGPFHVVASLVLPRMNALAELDNLHAEQCEQLRRMVEFIRHRWRGYVSDYRRWKNARIDEDQLAAQLGRELKVAARVGSGRRVRVMARPLLLSYLPSALSARARMDVVLAGKPDLAIIDEIHARPLPVPRIRGVRSALRAQMEPGDFLKFLGAPIGPRITQAGGVAVAGSYIRPLSRQQARWVAWSSATYGRSTGLRDDWVSDDIDWFVTQWSGWSERQRALRGRALFASLSSDWERLAKTATCQPVYFYYQWNDYGPRVAATWIGRLRELAWIPSADGQLREPTELVLNMATNRLATAGDESTVLAPGLGPAAMSEALGVRVRPTPAVVVQTLQDVRERTDELEGSFLRRVSTACYETLAAEIEPATPAERQELVAALRPKFTGNGRVGLIYAPPPLGTDGRDWWPPTRTVLSDVASDAGPYVGQLAGRHRTASALWDALGVARDLSPELAAEVIRLEMAKDELTESATHFYGQLVMRLEEGTAGAPSALPVPALTTEGWVHPSQAWWTRRHEVRQAFGSQLAWWTPGAYDPSLLARSAKWLGIGELTTENVEERWQQTAPGDFPEPTVRRWRAAVIAWPAVLRSEGRRIADADRLVSIASALRVVRVLSIEGQLSFPNPVGLRMTVSTKPICVLRVDERVLVATSEESLFSRDAADVLSAFVGRERLHAANTLFALLTESRTSPEAFTRKYGSIVRSVSGIALEGWESEQDVPDGLEEALKSIRDPASSTQRAAPVRPAAGPPRPERKLQDPTDFELNEIEDVSSGPGSKLQGTKRKRRYIPPKRETQDGQRQKRDQRPILSNPTIEEAARPYVERFELRRGAHRIDRQAALVGADYVADDGRYIEVKATGGTAEDAFDLEESEWGAALDPRLRDDYWVYVVEHLADDQEPTVTAVFNPVRDDNLSQSPVGKMRITGWRSAAREHRGVFRRIRA